jgi:anti-sigma regulatory factor (Ser/Thr protein kinase)
MESLAEARQFLLSRARAEGFPNDRMADVEISLEEALVNIFKYAYPGGGGNVEIACRTDEAGTFVIEISDAGIPFDILSVKEPDVTLDINDRRIGGLGILLMRKFMDNVTYRREEGRNILTLAVSKTPKKENSNDLSGK